MTAIILNDDDWKQLKEETEEDLDARGFPEDTFSFDTEHPTTGVSIIVTVSNRQIFSVTEKI